MRKRLILILAVIVLLPLIVLIGFGIQLAHREQEQIESRYNKLLRERLHDINKNVDSLVRKLERELSQNLEVDSFNTDILRERTRNSRLIRQIFVLGLDGRLIYPQQNAMLSQQEQKFLTRTSQLWDSGELFWSPPETNQQAHKNQRSKISVQQQTQSFGWHTWFWGEGLHLIFWVRRPDANIIGAEVERSAMIADIIGKLPAADYNGSPLADGRVVLTDARNKTIYQWGDYAPPANTMPAVSIPAPHPFDAWNFHYYIQPSAAVGNLGRSSIFNIASGLIVLTLALSALAIYFYRESSRDIRLAAQRVTFVNQVSHELKTPLTNIRLYAELLEQHIPEHIPRIRKYVDILVAETHRLSRMINNVLTFAKQRHNKLQIQLQPTSIDRLFDDIITAFTPAFNSRRIKLAVDNSINQKIMMDADKVEQILGNLINNVDKYAKNARNLSITSKLEDDFTVITLCDDGPGIPPDKQELIFQPFVRLSNKLSDGVSGTGIGLTIARRLARMHGGDLTIIPSQQGACFMLRLHTPAADETNQNG